MNCKDEFTTANVVNDIALSAQKVVHKIIHTLLFNSRRIQCRFVSIFSGIRFMQLKVLYLTW